MNARALATAFATHSGDVRGETIVKHSMSLRICAVGAVAVLAMGMTACGDKKSDNGSKKKDTSMSQSAAQPFGAGCSAVPKTGKGSFEGMSSDPVATAASNNPALSTLVSAVTAADLGGTLNGASNITVFAPANSAFDKITAADLQKLLANKAELTKV
ncbi:MAG TPA: fasciclin domain-containing protein, partial [Mycobacteriales bacterium]|nr:fasciclin domain-containing protein [Mycobacteriales bacterium]